VGNTVWDHAHVPAKACPGLEPGQLPVRDKDMPSNARRLPMTSYVNSVLQPGETVRYVSDIHWKIYIPAVLLLALAAVLFWIGLTPVAGSASWIWHWMAAVVLVCAAVAAFIAWFQRWTTEVAVTDRRIIYKRGFISRRTIEMHLDKVESVDVDQSILGRILNYGDILIRGVGEGIEPLKDIESPIEFRNNVTAK
jgi:membrane protein YdbS with pleckstrin-like domain